MNRVAVIGAGASGLVASVFAARSGADVTLLEGERDCGRKLLLSGGGRCNVLPGEVDGRRFVTDSSVNTLRKILRSWPLADQVRFFEQDVGVPLVQEGGGGRFPASGRAAQMRDALLALVERHGVHVMRSCRITGISREDDTWRAFPTSGDVLSFDALVVATGGLSYPETGSDGAGLAMLAELGLTTTPTYPALTPISSGPSPFNALTGLTVDAVLTAERDGERFSSSGGFLFTHTGYSGPAVLEVSHVLSRSQAEGVGGAVLTAHWTGLSAAQWDARLRTGGRTSVLSVLREELPQRLAAVLLERAGVAAGTRLGDLRREDRTAVVAALVACRLPWNGCGGYDRAEVTGGGVSLSEIAPSTMESKRHGGLFLCGELLDVFGLIGGNNLLWAWVTGRAAGVAAARSDR